MRIGLQINAYDWPGGKDNIASTLVRIAREAEAAGFYAIWAMDHFLQIPQIGPYDAPILDSFAVLNNIAAVTRTVKLGTMVAGVTYRAPAVLIKAITTLDVLSLGRAYFGVGASWYEEEHVRLGIPYPPLKERFDRLEELLQIAHQLWHGSPISYSGSYTKLVGAVSQPQPISLPHPPVMIGGAGELRTLKLVAQYGDACNLYLRMGKRTIKHKLDVLRQHCAECSRTYSDIEKTCLDNLLVTAQDRPGAITGQALVDYFGRAAGLGFDQAIVALRNLSEDDVFSHFEAVRAQIAAIPPGGQD